MDPVNSTRDPLVTQKCASPKKKKKKQNVDIGHERNPNAY